MTQGPQKELFLLVLQRSTHHPLFNDKAIDQSHKSHNACSIRQIYHNASFCNRNVHNSVTKWCIVGCDTGALWDLCNKSIAIHSQCSTTGYGLIGLNQWDFRDSNCVILSSTGWAYTQNAHHNHSTYMDLVKWQTALLKTISHLYLAGAIPRMITAINLLLSFHHIVYMTKGVQSMITQASTSGRSTGLTGNWQVTGVGCVVNLAHCYFCCKTFQGVLSVL